MKTAGLAESTQGERARARLMTGAGVGLGVVMAASVPQLVTERLPHLTRVLQGPDWSVLAGEALVVQLHLATAVAALLIGAVLMAGAKGRSLHRRLGWTWAVCMAVTAGSSLFIHRSNPGGFSLIHGLSAWTLLALPMGVFWARKHQVVRHRRTMSGLFYGGLLVAGLLAFLPGRVLWRTFVG